VLLLFEIYEPFGTESYRRDATPVKQSVKLRSTS